LREYDCIVIGQDLYALTVALYLSRKMRKVLVIQDPTKINGEFEKINIKSEDKNYKFKYNRKNIVSGLDKSGLLFMYLDSLGLEKSLEYEEITNCVVVDEKGDSRSHSPLLDGFKIYLIRYYPKHIKEIELFFEDLQRHYLNYQKQHINMLQNDDYTLTSLMIEWGDQSLGELLKKYFTNDELILEFTINNFISGLPIDEINAYSFFVNYFIGLKNGFYLLKNSYKEIYDQCIEKLNLVNPNAIINTTVSEYVFDKKGKLEGIVDGNKNLIYAKYFFVSSNPLEFYSKNFDNVDKEIKTLSSYYPNIGNKTRINTLYLVLNNKLNDIGISDLIYNLKNSIEDDIRLTRVYNYSKDINQDQRRKEGLLCVDFVYKESTTITKEKVIDKLVNYFPKIKKFVVNSKLGKEDSHLTMLRDEKLRKNLSINELIDVESLEHIQVFDNLFVGGDFIRPEAGFYGVINQGIVFADKIEDKLYYGDSKDEFEYFSNDEIMMMIRHNYQPQHFGNKEIHINFNIGKSSYFIRTKGKNIVLHHGKHSQADLSIYTTNDKLSNLLLKKSSFNQILDSGFLKYRGDIDLLFLTVKAFQLDDYQKYSPEDYLTSKIKFLGVKLFFAHMIIYSVAAFLSNYYLNIYIFPIAFILSAIVSIIKLKAFESVNVFEIIFNLGLLVASILSLFVREFNQLFSDDIFLGFIIVLLFVSVFANHPVLYSYHQFDMNIDYRNTKLFKIITSGITFIWGFIFLVILGGTYLVGNDYLSLFYSFLFFGILLTYFYPIIYVRTSIKK